MSDKIVDEVIGDFKSRSERGVEKYGTTLERTDIHLLGWLKHLREELMDATLYLQRLKEEISSLREEKALLNSINVILWLFS